MLYHSEVATGEGLWSNHVGFYFLVRSGKGSPLTLGPPIDVAVGIVVQQRDGQPWVLIARRPDHTVLGGYWEFPGGKIEPGEDAKACVIREYREELDAAVLIDRALAGVEHDYPHGRIRLHPFLCRLDPDRVARLQNRQVAEHRWIRPVELRQVSYPPANHALVDALIRELEPSNV